MVHSWGLQWTIACDGTARNTRHANRLKLALNWRRGRQAYIGSACAPVVRFASGRDETERSRRLLADATAGGGVVMRARAGRPVAVMMPPAWNGKRNEGTAFHQKTKERPGCMQHVAPAPRAVRLVVSAPARPRPRPGHGWLVDDHPFEKGTSRCVQTLRARARCVH